MFILKHLLQVKCIGYLIMNLNGLIDKYPRIERFVRLATAAALKGVIKRQAEVMVFSAEERFTALLKRSPHLLNMIPHKYMASYLGIDASTFSKLLNKIKL